jgi:hypothetical protein
MLGPQAFSLIRRNAVPNLNTRGEEQIPVFNVQVRALQGLCVSSQ